jgi:hypothetical protein
MLHPDQINWVAVLVATAANGVIGFLWYGPIFGNYWAKAVGKPRAELMSGATTAIFVSIVMALIMAAGFALLLTVATDKSITTGAVWGLVLGVGFVTTTKFISAGYENLSMTLAGLFAAYEIVALVVMGAILGAIK